MQKTIAKFRSVFVGRLALTFFLATSVGCAPPVQQESVSSQSVQTKQVRINDVTLNYIERGEGVPVVFVHGALGDYRTWDGQIESFSEKYRVISYSRRYHYPNELPQDASDTSISSNVEDLKAFIQALNIGPFHLIGHSGGGFISLLYARDNPEHLISLTLGEPAVIGILATTPEGTALLQDADENTYGPSTEAFQAGNDEEGVRRFIDGVMGGEQGFDRLPANFRANMMDNVQVHRLGRLNGSPAPSFFCEDARLISTPTLLLHGELSPKKFVLINDILEQCVPNTQRAVIPSVSHSLEMENPDAFNETVLGFLATH